MDILLSADEIRTRVEELGQQITVDYRQKDPLAICILKGAWVFFADLVRTIELPLQCDFLSVSSYGSGRESSGHVEFRHPPSIEFAGRDILLVEDIADTGRTLNLLQCYLHRHGAREVRTCVLLDKPERREAPAKLDYVGFVIPNCFVVGYGLDQSERYRHLPYIALLEEMEP